MISISFNIRNVFKDKKILSYLFICSFYIGKAQDVHFTQLAQTQVYQNPAFAGIQFNPRILLQIRNQYPKISDQINGGYNTYYISYDQFIKEISSGVGISIIADKLGKDLVSRYYINATYAFQARLNRNQALRFGLTPKMIIQQLDVSSLQFFDQIDPINGFQNYKPTQEVLGNNYSDIYFNLDFGALYNRDKFYFGASLRNLLPKKNFYNSSSRGFEDVAYSIQTGGVAVLNEEKRFNLFGFLNFDRQYGYNKLVFNGLVQYQMFNIGMGVRTDFKTTESISALFGLNFNSIRVSYSYDIPMNQLAGYSGGTHEIGLRVLIGGEDNSLKPAYHKNILFCPEFMKN